jgi:Fic-DOC domain mobile mystery protein B
MGIKLDYIGGQTPLDEIEISGLKIKTITTVGELNEHEQNNIEEAFHWALNRKIPLETLLTREWIFNMHYRMFNKVWDWAGEKRTSNKNIGVDKYAIDPALIHMLDDIKYWIDNRTFDPVEIAIRFKHRLVSIHCFPNGNGRHARLCADILIKQLTGRDGFTWGSHHSLYQESELRSAYIDALKKADTGDYQPLIEFAGS